MDIVAWFILLSIWLIPGLVILINLIYFNEDEDAWLMLIAGFIPIVNWILTELIISMYEGTTFKRERFNKHVYFLPVLMLGLLWML